MKSRQNLYGPGALALVLKQDTVPTPLNTHASHPIPDRVQSLRPIKTSGNVLVQNMANSIAGLIHHKPPTNEPRVPATGKSKKVKIDKRRVRKRKKTAFPVRGGSKL